MTAISVIKYYDATGWLKQGASLRGKGFFSR
ncbi:hypothetical protein SBA2_30136 [Acidobacteriia bacterium SbA2]|nr:hypothetical protein SBA2_30136 [Acidobacteriia bacterium SbA2]